MELMLFEEFVENFSDDNYATLRERYSEQIEYLQNIDESEMSLLNENFLKNAVDIAKGYFQSNRNEPCWKSKIIVHIKQMLGISPHPKLIEEVQKLLASRQFYGKMSTC
jgi:hypothetical protein